MTSERNTPKEGADEVSSTAQPVPDIRDIDRTIEAADKKMDEARQILGAGRKQIERWERELQIQSGGRYSHDG